MCGVVEHGSTRDGKVWTDEKERKEDGVSCVLTKELLQKLE
jgi:hypothetical protein